MSPSSTATHDPRRTATLVSCGTLIVATAAFTLLCNGVEVVGATLRSPGLALLSAVAAVLFAMPHIMVILWLDRNEKEPLHLLVTAFLWGAVLATGLSGLFNFTAGAVLSELVVDQALASQLTVSLSAPFIEELTKGSAMVALYLFFRHEFDNVLDGLVYGAMVGMGFAVFENWTYYISSDSVSEVLLLTLVRGVITGVGTHAVFTAITGASLGMFRVLRSGPARWLLPPMGLGLAMYSHFMWNTFTGLFIVSDDAATTLFLSFPAAVTVLQLPFLLLVLTVAALALRHETALISTYLGTEEPPGVREDDLHTLVPARRRSWASARLLLSGQLGPWRARRRRNALLIRLAFEKWHMDREAHHGNAELLLAHGVQVERLRKLLAEGGGPTR